MNLVPSKYLVTVPLDKDSSILYHSLFGGAVVVKRELLRLIETFNFKISTQTSYQRIPISRDTMRMLRKHSFLVPAGTDEYILLKKQWEREGLEKSIRSGALITNLRLEMVNYCNFRCKHCFVPRLYCLDKKTKMSFSTAKRAIDSLVTIMQRNKNKFGSVTFWGGEPLFNWGVVKSILHYLEQIARSASSIVLQPSIITNGSMIDDEIASVIKHYGSGVLVSLDGFRRENDAFRMFQNGRGTFGRIIQGLDTLKKHKVEFGVELCINDYNFNSIEKLIDFLIDRYKRFEFITILYILYDGVCPFDSHTSKEKAQRVAQIFAYLIKKRLGILEEWEIILEHALEQRKPRLRFCYGQASSLYVNPQGVVFPCHLMRVPLGKVQDIEKVYHSKNYKLVASRSIYNIEGCRGCIIEGMCAGGCPGRVAFYSHNIYRTDNALVKAKYCEFRRHLFKELLKFYVRRDIAKEGKPEDKCIRKKGGIRCQNF